MLVQYEGIWPILMLASSHDAALALVHCSMACHHVVDAVWQRHFTICKNKCTLVMQVNCQVYFHRFQHYTVLNQFDVLLVVGTVLNLQELAMHVACR